MKYSINVIFIIIFSIVVGVGCAGRNHDSRLEDANRIVASDPDSALVILEKIDVSELSGKSDRAYYAILLTEARYKAGFDDVSDSLISTAVDFYKDDMENPLRTRAYYYNGIINWNSKRLVEAVISLKEAEKSALETGDTLHLALIHRSFGDCYHGMFNQKTSLIYFKRSYDEFDSIHNSYYLPDAAYDLVRAYFNCHAYDSCIMVGEHFLSEIPDLEERLQMAMTQMIGKAAVFNKDYAKSLQYYDQFLSIPGADLSLEDLPFIGIAAFELGQKDKIIHMVDSFSNLGKSDRWTDLFLAKAHEDYKEAYACIEDIHRLEVEKFENWMMKDYENSLINHYEWKQKERKIETQNKILYILILFILILSVLVIFILKLRWNKKKNERDLVDKIELVGILKEELIHNKNMISELEDGLENNRVSLRDSLASQFSLLDKLLKRYYDSEEPKSRQKTIYEEISKEIKNLQTNKKVLRDMKALVDSRFNNIMTQLNTDFPEISGEDEKIFLFTIMGLSGKSMGVLLDMSPEYIYNRKHALRSQISHADVDMERYKIFL